LLLVHDLSTVIPTVPGKTAKAQNETSEGRHLVSYESPQVVDYGDVRDITAARFLAILPDAEAPSEIPDNDGPPGLDDTTGPCRANLGPVDPVTCAPAGI
jgi:hypothetical protein